MKTRIREGQWKFVRYAMEGRNDLLRRITEEMMENKKSRWMKGLMNEIRNIRVQNKSTRSMTDEGIRAIMKEWDTREWKQGMNEKTSLSIYRKWRTEIGGQEKIYDNRQTSEILYKCRTNTLKLKDRNRFRNEETKCEMCGVGEE